MKTGASYFGNRALKYVKQDMKYMKEQGLTHVFHTFSEEDILFYKETMKEIVAASKEEGLKVYMGPWGVGNIFGGEALSKLVAMNYDCWQVASDGKRYPTMCLNSDIMLDYMKKWIAAAKEAGADTVFWDEPHWLMPLFFGIDQKIWGCCCERCKTLYKQMFTEEMGTELTDNIKTFKIHYMKKFIFELSGFAKSLKLEVAVCLLPMTKGPEDDRLWHEIAECPDIDVLSTDPYWMFGETGLDDYYLLGVEGMVRYYSDKIMKLSRQYNKEGQIWIQNFIIKAGREKEVGIAFKTAYEAGIRNIFAWSFRGSEYMSYLRSDRPEVAWNEFLEASRMRRI